MRLFTTPSLPRVIKALDARKPPGIGLVNATEDHSKATSLPAMAPSTGCCAWHLVVSEMPTPRIVCTHLELRIFSTMCLVDQNTNDLKNRNPTAKALAGAQMAWLRNC